MRWVHATAVASCAFLAGCATIISPGPDLIVIESQPSGARVHAGGQYMGVTPCSFYRGRNDRRFIRLDLEGYVSTSFHPKTVFNGWFLANVLNLFTLGALIDGLADNAMKYDDDKEIIVLLPVVAKPGVAVSPIGK